MVFALFILLNAILFLRPTEMIPAIENWPVYQAVIVTCVLVNWPRIQNQLTWTSLRRRPITICVLGLFTTAIISIAIHKSIWVTLKPHLITWVRLVAYYLVLVAVVNRVRRLDRFLSWICIFLIALTAMALMQHHGIINIPALAPDLHEEWDDFSGEASAFIRLCGPGIFHDPNALCLILVTGAMLSIYQSGERRYGPLRFAWWIPVVMFGYALALTHSRGGFLAMVASLGVLFYFRFGWQRALILAALILPVLLVLFGGRQTEISTTNGTAHERLQLWSEGLQAMRSSPVFGIGMGQYDERIGMVAHNSFVHSFVELGFVGGSMFLGAFLFSFYRLFGLRRIRREIQDRHLQRLLPYMAAILTAYAIGYMSLSQMVVEPTYLILGLVTVYLNLVGAEHPMMIEEFDMKFVRRVTFAAVCFLAFTYVFIRTFVHWG